MSLASKYSESSSSNRKFGEESQIRFSKSHSSDGSSSVNFASSHSRSFSSTKRSAPLPPPRITLQEKWLQHQEEVSSEDSFKTANEVVTPVVQPHKYGCPSNLPPPLIPMPSTAPPTRPLIYPELSSTSTSSSVHSSSPSSSQYKSLMGSAQVSLLGSETSSSDEKMKLSSGSGSSEDDQHFKKCSTYVRFRQRDMPTVFKQDPLSYRSLSLLLEDLSQPAAESSGHKINSSGSSGSSGVYRTPPHRPAPPPPPTGQPQHMVARQSRSTKLKQPPPRPPRPQRPKSSPPLRGRIIHVAGSTRHQIGGIEFPYLHKRSSPSLPSLTTIESSSSTSLSLVSPEPAQRRHYATRRMSSLGSSEEYTDESYDSDESDSGGSSYSSEGGSSGSGGSSDSGRSIPIIDLVLTVLPI